MFEGFLGTAPASTPAEAEFDPVYGLPWRAVREWLDRNPQLMEEYEAELRERERHDGG
jgi:hypothetical protein